MAERSEMAEMFKAMQANKTIKYWQITFNEWLCREHEMTYLLLLPYLQDPEERSKCIDKPRVFHSFQHRHSHMKTKKDGLSRPPPSWLYEVAKPQHHSDPPESRTFAQNVPEIAKILLSVSAAACHFFRSSHNVIVQLGKLAQQFIKRRSYFLPVQVADYRVFFT